MDQITPPNIPNLTLLCRLCLCEDVYMFPIFNDTNIYLPQRIAACVNVEVYKSDSISTLICKQCLNKINDWNEFKKYCSDSQTKLQYWSTLRASNDPINKSNQYTIKEEIVNYDEGEIIIPENVGDVKIELIETSYEEISDHDEISNNDEFPNNVEFLNNDEIFINGEFSINEEFSNNDVLSHNEEFSNNEESDPVSTTYFLPDENREIEPEPETLLVPVHELAPDAHSINVPPKQSKESNTKNDNVDLKIGQVYQLISCRICELSFSWLGNRARHEKVKHMLNVKDLKCLECDQVWDDEEKLLDHYKLNHLNANESNFIKPETKIIKNGYAYNTFEKSQEYLKEFAKNLILLRNRIPSAKQISLKSFMYYNQCIQKMIDRNSIDSNTSLDIILDNLLSDNLIIKNSCHECCISFRGVTEFKQHISKRYCKKRVRLVESGQIQSNEHFKCIQCDRIFGCKIVLTHHIKSEHLLNVNVVPTKCNTCLKPFQYRHEYSAHIQETCSYKIYCSICELIFDTTDHFKLHTKVQHDIESNIDTIFNHKPRKLWKNKCCLCPKFYRYYSDLSKHFKITHSEFELKTCEHCGDNFMRDEELQMHINSFHFKKSGLKNGSTRDISHIYSCFECNIAFSTIKDLEQHKIIHNNEFSDSKNTHSLDSSLFTCNICAQTFDFEEELEQHNFTNHDNITEKTRAVKFRCTICKLSFNTNQALVTHNVKMHSIKNKERTSCLKCQKTFKNQKSLNAHMKTIHRIPATKTKNKKTYAKLVKIKTELEGNDDMHVCIVCKKIFISRNSLICHAKSHYNRMRGPHCEVCGKRCKGITDLLEHFKSHPSKLLINLMNMNSHEKQAQYQQQLKQQQQQLKQQQQQLKQQQQQRDNVSEHKCYICKKIFTTKGGLNVHFAMMHRKLKFKIEKQFSCVVCAESFVEKNELATHVQSHVNNFDKFTCEYCNESYLADDYQLHMSKLHNTNTCIFCNKSFFTQNGLMSHKSWHFR